jgi:hypothetical protein
VISQVSSCDVLLLWEAPENDGNSDIINYKVDYRQSGRWIIVDFSGRWVIVDLSGRWVIVDFSGRWIIVDFSGRWLIVDFSGRWVIVDFFKVYCLLLNSICL